MNVDLATLIAVFFPRFGVDPALTSTLTQLVAGEVLDLGNVVGEAMNFLGQQFSWDRFTPEQKAEILAAAKHKLDEEYGPGERGI